jgi:hypothetical protein
MNKIVYDGRGLRAMKSGSERRLLMRGSRRQVPLTKGIGGISVKETAGLVCLAEDLREWSAAFVELVGWSREA